MIDITRSCCQMSAVLKQEEKKIFNRLLGIWANIYHICWLSNRVTRCGNPIEYILCLWDATVIGSFDTATRFSKNKINIYR